MVRTPPTEFTRTVQAVLDDEALAAAGAWGCSDLPTPSLAELRRLALLTPEIPLRVMKLHAGGHLTALSICRVEKAVIHGIPAVAYRSFGAHLHDYTRLYAEDGAAISSLLGIVRQDARACGADVVHLHNQLLPIGVEAIPSTLRSTVQTALFDAFKSQQGWREILERRSVQRDWKKVCRNSGYRVDTAVGTFGRNDIEELGALHRERWGFAGVPSAFEKPRRLEEYLCHPANKVLTRVRLGNELLCCHYGMLYGNLLLFHTPVINIKFLDYSPLKTLLAETARFCEASNLRYLDFGLGDESYKEYSSNSTRDVHELLIPITARGRIIHLLHRHARPERVKSVLEPVINFVHFSSTKHFQNCLYIVNTSGH